MTQPKPQLPRDPPFSASASKIRRARKHIAELESITAAHVASKPVSFTVYPPEPGILLKIDMHFRGPGDEYSAVFGDAVHNLRTALDLMATDLVRANGGNEKGVHFPFADSAGELEYQITNKKFHRAGAAAAALLKQVAPHRGGNAALRALHDLDVLDKHKQMIPSAVTFTSPTFRMDQDAEGRPILVPVTAVDEPTSILLTFPDDGGVFAGKEVIPTLHQLVELTAGVVEAFKALCEVPGVVIDAAGAHGENSAEALPPPLEGDKRDDA